MAERIPLINFDEMLPRSTIPDNDTPLMFQRQFGVIISGRSGVGKTNLLLNCLTQYLKFDSCRIFLKDTEEPLYQLLEQFFTQIQKKRPEFEFLISDDLADIPDPSSLDPTKQHVIVFDDLVNTPSADPYVREISLRGRKHGISWFYLSQRFFDINKLVRENANYVCLYKSDRKTVTEFFKTFGHDVEIEEFYRAYNQATKKRHDFFLIDLKTDEDLLRYRRNFDGVGLVKAGR